MSALSSYELAKKRVGAIKGFYAHLTLFLLISVLMLTAKGTILEVMAEKNQEADPNFLEWMDWNFISVILIWGALILIQGFVVFGRPIIKKWEKRKIEAYLERDKNESAF
ncbi:2TM domain-containing protein [Allomuricauda sp. M10]|uniref:2TM domain-containing protein n=1 Tax=Allomuricauda sp. M10 TaxID=2683292 RepID=UPI001D180C71|nr:2TM domain-containing protein [Muricauda sp. M10]